MRRHPVPAFATALALALAASGCSSCGDEFDTFDVRSASTTTVQGNPLGAPIGDIPFGDFGQFDLSQTEQVGNQGVDKSDIDSARLRSVRLTVISGDSFESFLSTIEFWVEADGLPTQRVAHREGIDALPADTRTLDCELDDVQLKPYVAAPAMRITTRVTGELPSQDTTIEAVAILRIDVNLI